MKGVRRKKTTLLLTSRLLFVVASDSFRSKGSYTYVFVSGFDILACEAVIQNIVVQIH